MSAREVLKQLISARNLYSSDPIANDVPRECWREKGCELALIAFAESV
jgi:hypothetical protein